ncbi:hypothetical protein ACGFS9_19030 [Streptomyces sp. NPDC048566]|uniref:hypothetical protein n=1 Tax=Streptomyces sp. NPDC048566 TaxID=3365569 RepID=UPI0037107DA4
MQEQERELAAAQEPEELDREQEREEPGGSAVDSEGHASGTDVFARRARILAGMTLGAVIVTAVAAGDPTPTMTSWA